MSPAPGPTTTLPWLTMCPCVGSACSEKPQPPWCLCHRPRGRRQHQAPRACVTGPGADDNLTMANHVPVRRVCMFREATTPLVLVSPAPGPTTTSGTWSLCHRPRGRRHQEPPGSCVTGPGADDNITMADFVTVSRVCLFREATTPLALVSPAPGPTTTSALRLLCHRPRGRREPVELPLSIDIIFLVRSLLRNDLGVCVYHKVIQAQVPRVQELSCAFDGLVLRVSKIRVDELLS